MPHKEHNINLKSDACKQNIKNLKVHIGNFIKKLLNRKKLYNIINICTV